MWRLAPQALAERPHIETITALCRPLHGDDATWQKLREFVTAIDSREPFEARLERRDGTVRRLHGGAAAQRRDAGDVPRRDRFGERRARAARAQRGAGRRRQDQDRFRPPRVLRAALAAHQHHRLRPSARRSVDRAAGAEAARISRLHHRLHRHAAGADQQHPRPRHHRRRPHAAQSRRRRYPRHHGGRRRRRAGSPGRPRPHARHQRAARTSAPSPPTNGASGKSCSTSWPMP